MRAFFEKELKEFFSSLEDQYNVQVPVKLFDGTRSFGKINEGELALLGGKLPIKPTHFFFPQICATLNLTAEKIVPIKHGDKPYFIVGFTAEDADCLEFIDRFFSHDFVDDVYFDRRQNAVIVCVTGCCGKEGEFLKLAEKNCDIELIFDGQKFISCGYTEKGKALLQKIPKGIEVQEDELIELKKQSDSLSKEDERILEKASQLLLQDKVPDEFWDEIAKSCIACTACTLFCPTCTCFDVFDRPSQDGELKRWRMADSCLLDGFMREASGHNPLGTESLRTRQRIHHKLAADVKRYGHKTCYLCGRCDEVCPSNIGIKAVSRKMVQQYGHLLEEK